MNHYSNDKNSKPELVIAIVAKIGTRINDFNKSIKSELTRFGYKSHHIKVTDALTEINPENLVTSPLDKRYFSYIKKCNELRKVSSKEDLFALYAVSKIYDFRVEKNKVDGLKDDDIPSPIKNQAYIINQFKTPKEVERIRQIYGRQCIVISLYDSFQSRLSNLSKIIAKDHPDKTNPDYWRHKSEELIYTDEGEAKKYGQDVRNAFPLADIVLDVSKSASDLTKDINRFMKFFHGAPTSSPNKHEASMFSAYAASLQSADLSRQVGAAIVDSRGSVLVTGCNEAPSPNGRMYWSDDDYDNRDVILGNDANEEHKDRIIRNFLSALKNDGWLIKKLPAEINEFYDYLKSELGKTTETSRADIFDIIEFGRSVHAEMNAITDAARRGVSLDGAILYCTTYPCHNCAKHIIASGIKKVVYLEPYPKSLVTELHSDAVVSTDSLRTDDPNVDDGSCRVIFQQFLGIAPARYQLIYRRKRKRKNSIGAINDWSESEAQPIREVFLEGFLSRELRAKRMFAEFIAEQQGEPS